MTKEELIAHLKKSKLDQDQIDEIMALIDDGIRHIHEMKLENEKLDVLFKGIAELANGDGFKNILELIKAHKTKNLEHAERLKDIEYKNLIDARKYLRFKYWQDIIMVSVIIIAITLMAFCDVVEKATVGTLMGAIIGYALGRFKGKATDN